MTDDGMTRKLAAIMAADVVGYSRLMSIDEAATLARMTACIDDIVAPSVSEHEGRIFKTMGDGLLAEFASAVEAVECAVQIQHAMAEHAPDIAEDQRVIFRIGINLGDIMIKGDDVFGDGVNVAARIEALSDPGGVFISRSVSDQISGKLDFALEDLGKHTVKNIPLPVHVFRVLFDGAQPGKGVVKARRQASRWKMLVAYAAAAVLFAAAGVWWSPWQATDQPSQPAITAQTSSEQPSIAILPFDNMSGEAEQGYFSDGMTEDLITDLSKVSGLTVISRTSSFSYKQQSKDVRTIARELNVRYVVEGSVRKVGNTIRINAQLIDAQSGTHVWADRYDGKLDDIFSLQDKITEKIVSALALSLSPREQESLKYIETRNMDAYELFLRGRDIFMRFSRDNTYLSRGFFEKALQLDPEFARPYAMLAWTYAYEAINEWSSSRDATLNRALDLANKSLATGVNLPVAHFVKGFVFRERHEYEKALAEAKESIELDPNYPNGHVLLATLLFYAGQPEEGLQMIQRASQLNPLNPSNYPFHEGQALFILKRYDEAIDRFERGLKQNSTSLRLRVWLAATYAQAGRQDDAEWEAEQVLMAKPSLSLKSLPQAFPFRDPGELAHIMGALKKAGFTEEL